MSIIELKQYPDRTIAKFNGGNSVFVVDDHCYVLKNLVGKEWKSSPYIYAEAFEVLKKLPPL